jgi:hypothetical protein
MGSREEFLAPQNAYEMEPELSSAVFAPINDLEDHLMGRYLLLWLLGVPLPILFLIWIIGGLH